MANLVANQYVRIRTFCEDVPRTQTAINSWYMQVTVVVGNFTMLDLANAMGLAVSTPFKGLMSNKTRFAGAGAKGMKDPATPEELSSAGNGLGVSGISTMPGQVCGLASVFDGIYHTGNVTVKHPAGVQKIGTNRVYFPFPPLEAGSVGAGEMSNNYYNNLKTVAPLLWQSRSFIGGGGGCTIVGRVRYVVNKVQFFTAIDTTRVLQSWATQRRRGDRGQHEISPI